MTAPEASARLLLLIAVVIAAARVGGWLAAAARQPRVMGEIVAGIALGPSLLGAVWPEATGYLAPPEVLGGLRAVAQLGLVLFMFLVGLELDIAHLRGQGHRAVVISHASIVVPFALGGALAWAAFEGYGRGTDRVSFALFIGVAMSITAFPVLARVIQEAGLDRTRIGSLALTCAAVDDVTAWCVLAVVVASVGSGDVLEVLRTIGLSLAFVAVMLAVVRPALRRTGELSLPFAVALALASAWVTEQIGIHAIFGAFLAGVVAPRSEGAPVEAGAGPSVPADAGRHRLTGQLELITTSVLLPMFFVQVGLSTEIGSLRTAHLWLATAVVIGVAVVGKLGGSAVAARLVGEAPRDALVIGVLMNTRGLTEIVILTVGLELGVITGTVFTMMVLMALATTVMAGPALRLLDGRAGAVRNSFPPSGPE